MKHTFYLFIALFITLIFSACQENGIVFPSNINPKGIFDVNIDGELFSTENVSFTSNNKDIFINATKTGTNEIFTLKIADFAIGSFSFEGVNTVGTYVQNDIISADVWTTNNAASSKGNINFTNIDFVKNNVSGTFSFIGENPSNNNKKAFTNGSFNNVPKDIAVLSSNKFTAKVDGFIYENISLSSTLVNLGSKELIIISANKSLTETIRISLEADISSGEYDFGSFTTQTYPTGQYTVNGSSYLAEGKISITTHDTVNKIISGTFEFNASPAASVSPNFSITEGEFSVSY